MHFFTFLIREMHLKTNTSYITLYCDSECDLGYTWELTNLGMVKRQNLTDYHSNSGSACNYCKWEFSDGATVLRICIDINVFSSYISVNFWINQLISIRWTLISRSIKWEEWQHIKLAHVWAPADSGDRGQHPHSGNSVSSHRYSNPHRCPIPAPNTNPCTYILH